MRNSRKTLWKKIAGPFLQRWHRRYFSRPRRYRYKDVSVLVAPGVFPPHLTFSTKALLDFLETAEVDGKTLLELGCGCGVISCRAARRGAFVTATDINPEAIVTLRKSASDNRLEMEVFASDLFDELGGKRFGFIVINPPYYPKEPQKMEDRAWFCGEDFGYFKRLFAQLPDFIGDDNQTFMVLSDDCDLNAIEKIAAENGIAFSPVFQQRNFAGRETVFSVSSSIRAAGARYR
jgi:release factor glutamine methyltransferase